MIVEIFAAISIADSNVEMEITDKFDICMHITPTYIYVHFGSLFAKIKQKNFSLYMPVIFFLLLPHSQIPTKMF